MSLAAPKPLAVAERYRAQFEAAMRREDALSGLRLAAFERFAAAGFPTQREEDWKYTSLRRLESRQFLLPEVAPVAPDPRQWIDEAGFRVALINGRAVPALFTSAPQPPGVTVVTLGQWISNSPAEVARFLETSGPASGSALHALNTAFFQDGVVIDIADGVALNQPLYIIHQWAGAQPAMSHPKIFVKAGRNSRCTLIEHYLGANDVESFTNAAVSLELAAQAEVTHYRLQQESPRAFHIASVHAALDRDSRYECQDIALGASLGRASITATLREPGATATLHGLFAPGGSQHLDTCTVVDHVAPHTQSSEEYRGIADGKGRGVYRGKVIVRKDAQKIDSKQSSRNLLLSPTAEIDTRPELEIYANDVKCSHGATTGQLDATALFYLRSRGISEHDARALLIRAFAESILTGIEFAPVRHYLEERLHARFAGTEVAA